MLIPRAVATHLRTLLTLAPVVLVRGPRQCGKSTLVRSLLELDRSPVYFNLDDAQVQAALSNDAYGVLGALAHETVVIDEVQRLPQLTLVIKRLVDEQRTPGRFVLTGSADLLQLPRLSESLAGRMQLVDLWPLSQAEIAGHQNNFVDAAFGKGPVPMARYPLSRADIAERMLRGGYPELCSGASWPPAARKTWFDSYISTLINRDVRDIANVGKLHAFPALISLLAARAGSAVVVSDIAKTIGAASSTTAEYINALRLLYLVVNVAPWFRDNLTKRLVKSPKLYLSDSGMLANLNYYDTARLTADAVAFGTLLENFVALELHKLISSSESHPGMFYMRDAAGTEVDFVLERGRKVVGIEVKSTASPGGRDFAGLAALRDMTGSDFQRGILLYTGTQVIPFDAQISAVPVSALWSAPLK